MASPDGLTHRARLRAMTLEEIKKHAYAQIAEGGPGALSLNAIAKAMGMSGPAIYRYFASREDVMATLVTESFEDLADTMTAVAADAAGQAPERRLRAVAHAFRSWGLAAPHRYRLVFGSTYGTGELDPDRIIPAATRSMTALLTALGELDGSPPAVLKDRALARQLQKWGARQNTDTVLAPGDLLLGMLAWTRLHGIVSLEIEGFFDQVGVDPSRLYDNEIDHLVSERRTIHG